MMGIQGLYQGRQIRNDSRDQSFNHKNIIHTPSFRQIEGIGNDFFIFKISFGSNHKALILMKFKIQISRRKYLNSSTSTSQLFFSNSITGPMVQWLAHWAVTQEARVQVPGEATFSPFFFYETLVLNIYNQLYNAL